MSLLSSIQMASNALQADNIGLQVVGQNISNANTPDYIREDVNFQPAPTQQFGNMQLGTGVEVQSITQDVDNFLEGSLRTAVGNQANSDTVQQSYSQLEGILGALGNQSLQSSMNTFFSSISDIMNQPGDSSVANLAVLQGQALAGQINNVATQAQQLRSNLDTQVQGMASGVNSLLQQVASLNVQIASADGGSTSNSPAVGLQDQQLADLQSLSQQIGTQAVEMPDGSYSVYSGGAYLVAGGVCRPVNVVQTSSDGMTVSGLEISGINVPLQSTSGQLAGLTTSRDQVLGGFLNQLNQFAGTLANEFNKVYSSGQGLTGYTQASSQTPVDDPNVALNNAAAGLAFPPTSGSFQVLVENTTTGEVQTNTVNIQLNGNAGDTTLNGLAGQLGAISGLSASVADGSLTISSTDPDTTFAFANDNSGVLASLGINTFFTGSTAGDLGVNPDVVNDPGKFAASTSGIGTGTDNAATLANFMDAPLSSAGGSSIGDVANQLTDDVTQNSANAQAQASGNDTYVQTLQGQQSSISGVSIDDETVQMMTFEQSFQAAAKYISTLNSMLTTLMQL